MIYFILAGLIVSVQMTAQEYKVKVKSIGMEDGLVSRNIGPFFQDARGLMWMGSNEGMSSYDGYHVKSYTEQNNALISNSVQQIAQDKAGNLWLLGLDPNRSNDPVFQIFNPQFNKAIAATDFFGSTLPVDIPNISSIHSHHLSDQLWLITKDYKVYLYDQSVDVPVFQLVYTADKYISSAETCPQGIWLSTTGAFQLLAASGSIIREFDTGLSVSPGILGTDEMSNVYYHREMPNADRSEDNPPVIFVNRLPLAGATSEFWKEKRIIGFDPYSIQSWYIRPGVHGRTVYDSFLNELVEFDLEEEIHGFPKLLHFDRFGNGWASFDSKVNIVTLERSLFTNYLTDLKVFEINGYGARGLYVNDQNELFTNGLGPSYRIDLTTGEEMIFGPITDFYSTKTVGADTTLVYNHIYGGGGDQEFLKRLALVTDKQGNLWYTDEGVRLYKYDIQTKKFTDYTYVKNHHSTKLPAGSIIHWSAFFDSNEKLWLGGHTGLAYLDKKDSLLKKVRDYDVFTTLANSAIYSFHENSSGIWIGATTGLYLMNLKGEFLKRFHTDGAIDE